MKYLKKNFIAQMITFIMFFTCMIGSSFAIGSVPKLITNQGPRAEQSKKIEITKDQIQDECVVQSTDTFVRLADILLNDQEKVPQTPDDSMSKETLATLDTNTWYPATKSEIKNVSCYIDLKDTYKITHIAFFDTFGNPNIEFLQGSPFHWNSITNHKMSEYIQWVCIPVENVETRYLQILSDSLNSGISEIAIYGYMTKESEKEPENPIQKPDFGITIDKAIGANGFIDDRMSEIKAVGHIREYHNFRWVITQRGQNKFNPAAAWPWDFDAYYQMLHENNIDIIPCIQGTSTFLLDPKDVASKNYTNNEKPLMYNADPSKPESYTDHASTLFQYAARYGSTKVEESKLLLASDQEKKTGLAYIQYYENNNEPDKNWETMKSYASPYELAAMCSADYDGHEGKMGDTYGIKNADPNSKLVMGGLAGVKTEYLDLMKLWFENNREDKKLAFDVINFHRYSSNQAPELTDFKEKCKEVTTWRDNNAPDKEVWLTEFGWDTNTGSPLSAPSQEIQGNWLVRGYLTAFGAGIDRVSMYMLRDASYAQNPGKYATSGLVTEKGAWTKKSSWYYVSTLKQTLTDYTLKEMNEQNNIYVYTFQKKDSRELCYALWCPTADGTKIDGYQLNIGDMTRATLTTMQDGYEDGVKSRLKIENGMVKVNVSESPIFVTVDGIEGSYLKPTNKKIVITSDMITSDNTAILEGQTKLTEEMVLANFKKMFDEQNVPPVAPEARYFGTLKTKWDNLFPYKFPLSAEINLGKKYKITDIGMYDSTATGSIKFYEGSLDHWAEDPSLEYGLNTYNAWVVKPVNMETQYIKIEKADNAECYEIILYGYSIEEDEQDPNYELNHPVKPEELVVNSSQYQIKNGIISGIEVDTIIAGFKTNIQTNAKTIQFFDAKGNEMTDGKIMTGMVVAFNGDERKEILSVIGDINGDGNVTSTDLLLLKRQLVSGNLQDWKLQGASYWAGDLNKDNQITPTDLLLLKRLILNCLAK